LARKDPDITLSAAERPIGGLGIYMVKKSMDDVLYEYKDGRNVLTIKKLFN
jgi:anti-sigma regulatory factor (Ser/Thr protein kinase)